MAQCPITHVAKAAHLFQFPASATHIKLGLTEEDATAAFVEIEERLSNYDATCDLAISAIQGDKTAATKAKDSGRRQIILTALEKTFAEKYANDIRSIRSSAPLLVFLKSLYETQTGRQKKQNAQKKLQSTVRRVHDLLRKLRQTRPLS